MVSGPATNAGTFENENANALAGNMIPAVNGSALKTVPGFCRGTSLLQRDSGSHLQLYSSET
jgi:hypothetical protein